MNLPIQTVLFDLDGTLLDTAPELVAALNAVRREQQCEPVPLAQMRPFVSHGAGTMISKSFNLDKEHPQFEFLRERLVAFYAEHLAEQTYFFPGMAEVLATLEIWKLRWGIVTNKPARLTTLLLERLKLAERPSCVVSGDTLPQKKPDPAPLLYACELTQTSPAHCVYVGDAARDVEAGRRAGLRTLVALYGYLDPVHDEPEKWGATALLEKPLDLIAWLEINRQK